MQKNIIIYLSINIIIIMCLFFLFSHPLIFIEDNSDSLTAINALTVCRGFSLLLALYLIAKLTELLKEKD